MLSVIFLLSGLILGSILCMLFTVNPVNAVIFLIAVFICSAINFIILNIDFIGFIFLMVYVGAITVLFLFIVMIINIRKIEYDNMTYLVIGGIIVLIICMQIIYIYISKLESLLFENIKVFDNYSLISSFTLKDEMSRHGLIYSLGILFFTNQYVLVINSGIILLVSIIGAVLLTSNKNGLYTRIQFNQLTKQTNIINIFIM